MRTCDVAIIGAGPAGMAAAVASHRSGASVLVIDDNPSPGGQIWRGADDNVWLRRFRPLREHILVNCRVVSVQAEPLRLLVENDETAEEIAPRKLIIATGAREIFIPFPGWTLPGVMGVGGLQAMAKAGLPIKGKRIVVAGSGPLLLAVAAYLRSHGAEVPLIAEQAPASRVRRFALGLARYPSKLLQAAQLQLALKGIPYHYDCWIEQSDGVDRLHSVRLRQGSRTWNEACDYAAVAYGLYPNTEVAQLLKCRMSGRTVDVDELQRTSVPSVFCAGECTGIGGVELSIIEGQIAGYAATGKTEQAQRLVPQRTKAQAFASAMNNAFALREELKRLPKADTIVCRCEDVTYGQLQQALSFRAAKLHTRCGMGPCQARICGVASDFLFGWNADSIRPPIFASRLGSLTVDKEIHREAEANI